MGDRSRVGIVFAALIVCAGPAHAASDAEKCEASKSKVAGKYYFCREKAEAKAILSGKPVDYTKCAAKFDEKWDAAENKVPGVCPDNVMTSQMNAYIAGQAAETAAIVSGALEVPVCGDGAVNVVGEQCDGADLAGETCASLGFVGGTLSCSLACAYDTSACACAFPASGQTSAYGPGSDGDLETGSISYTDNGDGTITDHVTGLMWEKKDDSGGLHDKDNNYTWGMISSPFTMNGTMVTVFLASLNTIPCFAGYCDWRIPNVKELQSIANFEVIPPDPMVSPAFDTGGTCSDVTSPGCSLTAVDAYWSSTTFRNGPNDAWGVSFANGATFNGVKSDARRVRAVRGGS